MNTLEQARDTQLKNIQARTGQTLSEIRAVIAQSGLSKHGEIRQMIIDRFGLSYGDANALVHAALASDGQRAAQASGSSIEEVVAGIYTAGKLALRPVHDAVMTAIVPFGSFEIIPKKGYVSLRRKKQFAMLGPGSKGRLELGINGKGLTGSARLETQAPGGMCQYKVYLSSAAEVDDELMGWMQQAYEEAG